MEEEEEHLPPPHQYIWTEWESGNIREALDKSSPALLNLSHDQPKLANVENLFLVHTDIKQTHAIEYCSYADPNGHACGTGSKDVMLDLGEATTEKQRMAILTYS